MEQLQALTNYFHDCYQSDNRQLTLFNFLEAKVENKFFFEKEEELVNGLSPLIPIDYNKAEKLVKKLSLNKHEKELIYVSFFICGKYTDFKGDQKQLIAPLFYYPAIITEKEGDYFLALKLSERRFNYPLLSVLSKGKTEDFVNDISFKKLSPDILDFGEVGKISKLCSRYFNKVNTDPIFAYPRNFTLKQIKQEVVKITKADSEQKVLLPFSAMGLVPKSENTRGVLNELKQIGGKKEFSVPYYNLFELQKNTKTKSYKKGAQLAVLNQAQKNILESASTQNTSLLVGPPGTGKSYTIAAIAIEHMSRGESVLIASKTNEAVDVVYSKIESQLGFDFGLLRGGRQRKYSTRVNKYLRALLTRKLTERYLIEVFGLPKNIFDKGIYTAISVEKANEKRLKRKLESYEKEYLNEVKSELKWGKQLSKLDKNLWDKLKDRYIQFRNSIQTPLWETLETIGGLDLELAEAANLRIKLSLAAQINFVVSEKRHVLQRFYEALKLKSDTERNKKFDSLDFNIIFKTFPIWLCKIADIKNTVPLKRELFDVAIIDEATQCDIASCLPITQRAKRVVFAGDPNQLRHISFLSSDLQQLIANKHNLQNIDSFILNYRNHSVLDLVMHSLQSNQQVAFLNEHYRSKPGIINFSNQEFYQGDLKLMTSRPEVKGASIKFIEANGTRTKAGVNNIEAAELINDVKNLVNNELDIPGEFATTIGVLSPFRAQVVVLNKMIEANFGLEDIQKHNIRVATAYGFQGEERDVMFLSMGVDSKSHHSAFIHLNKSDVFNVSITRAKQEQRIYVSIHKKDLPASSLLRQYWAGVSAFKKPSSQIINYHDDFLLEVKTYLEVNKLTKIWVAFSVAGLKIDLLLKIDDRYVGINLIGYPGEFESAYNIERNRILQRAGIKIFPLPYSDWLFTPEETRNELCRFLELKSE